MIDVFPALLYFSWHYTCSAPFLHIPGFSSMKYAFCSIESTGVYGLHRMDDMKVECQFDFDETCDLRRKNNAGVRKIFEMEKTIVLVELPLPSAGEYTKAVLSTKEQVSFSKKKICAACETRFDRLTLFHEKVCESAWFV